ncbi:hypothetical protein DXG03_003072 [Asterophora parasitica]|uniref:Uncharacterized protein n=1 Tax=Asterophora parasitica TaxID=117018 RepID=A0A9P7KDV7_9AGAR|nr:hypothetical protein DXG03_003072 [Asterophora parasitica]
MPESLNTDLYTYNSLNSFSFGSVQPQAPSSSSPRAIHPLSTSYGDADNEDAFHPDVTPRPSVVAYNHPKQTRSHQAQPSGSLEAAPSKQVYHRDHGRLNRDRDFSGRDSDTSSHLGASSASASVTSLSSSNADFSRTGSRASHRTSSTTQTSADHSSIDESDDDHRHPIPPHLADALSHSADSRGTGTGNNTAVEFSSDEEYGESEYDYDYYDEESGMHIEISSARYEGSTVTHDWDRIFYAGTSGSSGSIQGQPGIAYSERRPSLPMVIPGTTPPVDSVDPSMFTRDREDSIATLRRPSRSLDDDFKKLGLIPREGSSTTVNAAAEHPLQSSPVSVPESESDWRLWEERSKSRAKVGELEPDVVTSTNYSATQQPSPSPAPVDDFDLDWAQMRGGITAFDPNALADIMNPNSTSSSNDRRPSAASPRWPLNWGRDVRRPSTVTVSSYGGDSFGKAIRSWDGPRYRAQRRDWSFKREKADRQPESNASIRRPSTTGFLTPRGSIMTERAGTPSAIGEQDREPKDPEKDLAPPPSTAWKGMRLNAQEFWRNDLVGRFRVDRRATRPTDESKGPQQRLVVQPIRDPYIEVPAYGPPVTVHKHSKAVAFSISRHYRLPRKHDIPPTSSRTTDVTLSAISTAAPATKRSSSMILLAPRRVQEAYTSTNTTRKLESHGLLDEGGPVSSLEAREREKLRRNKERERQRQLQKAKEKERSKTNGEQTKSKGKAKQLAKDDRHVPSGSSPIAQPLPPPPASAPSMHTYPPASTASSSTYVGRESDSGHRTLSRNSSHHSHRRRRLRDPLEEDDDNDDDDENAPPSRTPHSEAFGTMDATLIEQLRQERFHNNDADRGGFFNRFLGRSAHSIASSSAQLHAPFVPPWLALQPRNKQESQQGVIDNLNDSFKDVGLLPSNYSTSRHNTSHRQKKIASGSNNQDPFRGIPPDSLYMLLPLWPGDTDPRSEIAAASFEKPFIPNDQRQYLLVYYKLPPDAEEPRKTRGERESGKRSRPSPTSSYDSTTKRDDRASVLLSTFHITARLIHYADLQGTGVRVPDEGITITGPLSDAFNQMPPPITETSGWEWVLGMCHSREDGIEFYPEGLVKMGLCLQTSYPIQALPSEEEFPEPDVKLTPVGRAILEMAWLGALALTSFGPGA